MKKLNKKGFTLIELLAVIAILAILVVVAVPGVLNYYQGAKKDTFKTQAQEIWKAAETQFVADSIDPTKTPGTYCYDGDDVADATGFLKLDLTGTKDVHYKIIFTNGVITSLTVEDGKNIATSTTTLDEIEPETFVSGTNHPISCAS